MRSGAVADYQVWLQQNAKGCEHTCCHSDGVDYVDNTWFVCMLVVVSVRSLRKSMAQCAREVIMCQMLGAYQAQSCLVKPMFPTLKLCTALYCMPNCTPFLLQAPGGGEDILLDELARGGVTCDPLTQLVITCEMCRRPATKQCWTCGMHICAFCTRRQHWKVSCAETDVLRHLS